MIGVHLRLSLDVRFMEGLDAAEQHALAAVGLAELGTSRSMPRPWVG